MARTFTAASSHYIAATLAATFGGSFPWTIACWVRSANETDEQYGFGASSIAGSNLHILGPRGDIANDPFVAYRKNGGDSAIPIGSTNYAADTWYHLLGLEVGSTDHQLFVNASQDATSGNTVGIMAATDVVYGCYYESASRSGYLSGIVAHCAGWEAQLDAAEIAALAKGFSPRRIRPQSLRFYDPGIRELVSLVGNVSSWTDSSGGVADHIRSYGM